MIPGDRVKILTGEGAGRTGRIGAFSGQSVHVWVDDVSGLPTQRRQITKTRKSVELLRQDDGATARPTVPWVPPKLHFRDGSMAFKAVPSVFAK